MLLVSNVTKTYNKVNVVDSLSFSVGDGRIMGFIGNNGAGKTTTISVMLGLKSANDGSVLYNNKPLSRYQNPAKVVGVVMSDDTFDSMLTVHDHLKSLAILSGTPKIRVDEVLREVGLADKAKTTIRKLSNGMKQKIKIASAILSEPKYLILDEPFNGLDPIGSRWLREFLQKYVKTGDKAVLISSHILSELALFIDDLVVIDGGKLVVQNDWHKIVGKNRETNLEELFIRLIMPKEGGVS